jgi:hypothetical protein
MKHLMPNDPRHEISRSTGGHFKRRHKRSPHRSRDVPLSLHCQHRHIPLRLKQLLFAHPVLLDEFDQKMKIVKVIIVQSVYK